MNLRPINIIAYTPCFYKSFFAKIHRWPKESKRAEQVVFLLDSFSFILIPTTSSREGEEESE